MVPPPAGSDPEHQRQAGPTPTEAQLTAGLKRLASNGGKTGWHLGSRFRNAFLTGLVIVGPVTITLWLMWGVIHWIDAWIKPLLPASFNPDNYLPFPVPGFGLVIAVFGLTLIGALAANLLGRALVSSGELMMSRTPIVRNVYGALKQIFESVISTTGTNQSFQKVGMIEFPSKEIWSLVFVTGETTGEIKDVKPGGADDLLTVFMPTGIVPPTGFICFVPRSNVVFLNMTVEEAAKIILSGGIVMPDTEQEKLKRLAEAAQKKSRFKVGSDKPAA